MKIWPIIALVVVIVIIIVVIILIRKPKETDKDNEESKPKETFFASAGGASVTPNNQVIVGRKLLTDQMVFGNDSSKLIDEVKGDAYYAIPGTLGAKKSKVGFDKLLQNQLEIQSINNKNDGQVLSSNQMKEINKKILSSADNNMYNMFNRAGTKKMTLEVNPGGKRAIIDGDYLPARDKNYSIASVSTVIPVKGFDMNMERIPEILSKSNYTKELLPLNRDLKRKQVMDGVKSMTDGGLTTFNETEETTSTESFKNKYRTSKGFMVNGNYNM